MDINGNGNGKRTAEQPKRRACDECRGRKLACSKEVDGCARCKREGIKCVYSPQKRMGRPRKQRPLEAAEPQAEVSEPREAPAKEVPPVIIPHFEFDSTIGMNLDFSFLDVSNTDVNFLDLVDPNSQFLPLPAQTDLNKTPPAVPKKTTSGSFWHMGTGSMGEINFDEPINPPSQSPGPEIITPEEALQITADIAETLPSLSPPPSSSPSTYASPAALDNVRPCGCLPALYLALDSLQTLPKEVGHAMLVARTAARTAHDTILCPVCGNPPFDPTSKPPMQAFQNLMMLGALLPSLSHAYMRILDMVDAEARAADAERRKIRFQLGAYGGMWGWIAKMDPAKCGATERLSDVMLDPILWRLTVRALLKLDVYGVNELDLASGRAEVEQGLHQPGLKDIINMMEERSRQRHQQMDEMVAAGLIENIKCEYIPLSSGEKPTCMRIIDIAKKSMEDLIIP